MPTSRIRRESKMRRGGTCDSIPLGAQIKAFFTMNGTEYVECMDGRIARATFHPMILTLPIKSGRCIPEYVKR